MVTLRSRWIPGIQAGPADLIGWRSGSNGSGNRNSPNGTGNDSDADNGSGRAGGGSSGGSSDHDSEPGNLITRIISQLRPGADLTRVVLPTYFLEPRSMLERITNFMSHPDMLIRITSIPDPVDRFVAVVEFYMTGWHVRPKGVKKPLNPVLGEHFVGHWAYPDGSNGYYLAEQTSHHPPKSSYFFIAPHHHVRVDGTLKPRSRFLGNSAASMMEGISVVSLLNWNERYFVTQPNVYVRNLLFGKMRYELDGEIKVYCPQTRLRADIVFKNRGYVSGTCHEVSGQIGYYDAGAVDTTASTTSTAAGITNPSTSASAAAAASAPIDRPLYELSGLWTGKMYMKNTKTGKETMFFDGSVADHTPISTRPVGEQEPTESRRLWEPVTTAIRERDHDKATAEKAAIEERQRGEAAARTKDRREWRPRFFRSTSQRVDGEELVPLDWILDADVDGPTPEERTRQVCEIVPFS